MRIVIRRDTKANWDANSQVVLLQGEQGYEINVDQTGVQRPTRIKVGDGISQWGQLPYFNGGITAIDEDTIIMDASGKIMFNKDLYLGGLTDAAGDSVSVKDYVDIKVSVEAEARTNGDSALGARIDQEATARGNVDNDLQVAINGIGNRVVVLETDPTTKAYVDGLILGEASVRADMDSLLGQRLNITNDSIDTLNTTDIFLQNQISENKLTSEQTDTALGELFDSVQANLVDSVAALEAADDLKADLASPEFTGAPTAPVAYDSTVGFSRVATLADVTYTATTLDAVKADASVVTALQADVDANEVASDAADSALDLRLDALEASTALADSVAALEAADTALEDTVGTLIDELRAFDASLSDSVTGQAAVNSAQADEITRIDGIAQQVATEMGAVKGTFIGLNTSKIADPTAADAQAVAEALNAVIDALVSRGNN